MFSDFAGGLIQVAIGFASGWGSFLTKCSGFLLKPLAELPIKWSGRKTTRRQYESMCNIPAGIPKDELDRRIEAFGAGHFGLNLTITLHGRQFRYVAPETEAKVEAPSIVPAEQRVA